MKRRNHLAAVALLGAMVWVTDRWCSEDGAHDLPEAKATFSLLANQAATDAIGVLEVWLTNHVKELTFQIDASGTVSRLSGSSFLGELGR